MALDKLSEQRNRSSIDPPPNFIHPEEEGATFLTSRTKYFPIFKDFLQENDLEARVRFVYEPQGPDHARQWRATIQCESY